MQAITTQLFRKQALGHLKPVSGLIRTQTILETVEGVGCEQRRSGDSY